MDTSSLPFSESLPWTGPVAKGPVEIKGYRGALSLLLDPSATFDSILDALESTLRKLGHRQFFQGSPIILQSGERSLAPAELERLQEVLESVSGLRLQTLELSTEPPEPAATPEDLFPELSASPEVPAQQAAPQNAPSSPALRSASSAPAQSGNSAQSMPPASPPLAKTAAAPTPPRRDAVHPAKTLAESQAPRKQPVPTTVTAVPEPPSLIIETPHAPTPPLDAEPTQQPRAEPAVSEKQAPEASPLPEGVRADSMLVVRQTLRSGQKIRTSQSIIVFGDLNSGAEIVSEGDIIVLGTIRGLVHAGASGDRASQVMALRLAPVQIRIADLIAQPPEESTHHLPIGPEKAFIERGQVIIENQSQALQQLLPMLYEAQRPESKRKAPKSNIPSLCIGTLRL